MSNPNIVQDTSGKHTGAKTEIGKIKQAASRTTSHSEESARRRNKRDSYITRIIEKADVKFSIPEKALKQRNLFEIFIKEHSVKELTEIEQLDKVIQILNTDMTQRTMEKITMGIALDDGDIKLIKLLKESIESLHKMKYGEKRLNVNASYQDIRELMMQE